VVSNAALAVMMMVCGPEVPRSAVGPVLGRIGEALPLTHGLLAIRETLAGQAGAHTAVLAAQEAGVGACWLAAAVAVLAWRARRSRRDGAALFLT
jgi:ABC-2 type transport system permease protein